MALKKQLLPILNANKETLETTIDATGIQIWKVQELKRFLRAQDSINFIFSSTSLTADDLIKYLTEYSYLQKIKFKTPRIENLFLWRSVSKFAIFPALRPDGYYTHQTALHIHGLGQLLDVIYFNHEQPIRPTSGVLEQSRIDNAFSKGQRLTSARTNYDGIEYWLLNGKQTGRYGVTTMKTSDNIEVPVTDLERTLVDITVRPAYAGGVNNVLRAYQLAQPKLSIQKLADTIRALKYVYPYHQSIGFYIDAAGVYDEQDSRLFLNFGPFQYDFYLDYKMINPYYSEKWKLYYPTSFISL
jgi:hypothetical protein